MAIAAVLSRQGRGATAQTLVWLIIGLSLLAASALALYSSHQNALLTAYNSSPPCATIADAVSGQDCRYTATAQVTQLTADSGGLDVEFTVPGPYTPFYMARLQGNDSVLSQGDLVQVEFWRYKVTKLNGASTADNPANDPRAANLVVIALLLLPFGLGATGWGIMRARRRVRGADGEEGPSPGMGPVAVGDILWR